MSEHHARLSPSGAARWLTCPGSVVLEAAYPDTGSVYADEGTAAHTLAAMCLQGTNTLGAEEFLGEKIRVGEREFEVTKDMAAYVQSYVDFVRERAVGKTLLVEQRVPIGHVTGEEGAAGTADAIVIDASNHEITVIDLKYGMGVRVEAEDNEQVQMYALGAVEECEVLADIDWITMVIHQPRMAGEPSEWRIARADLERFAERAAAGGDNCRAAHKNRESHDWGDAYLTPDPKGCKFCRAKPSCPALRAEMFEVIGANPASAEDFAEFVAEEITDQTGDNWLSVFAAKADMLEGLISSARAELARRMLSGKTYPDWKLVEGKQGDRKWVSEEAALKYLKGSKLPLASIYERKLISPTAAEKLLKKSNPARWEKAKAAITRAPGRPSVAPIGDKRPALSVGATAEDFRELVQTEE